MRVSLIILLSAITGWGMAHNPRIATFTMRDSGMGWYVEMNFSTSSFTSHFQKQGMINDKISEERFKEMFVEYVRKNFHLESDGEKVKLESGGVRLGSHQSDAKFLLPEMKENPKVMSIHIPMFEAERNHTNIFRFYHGGESFTKFFLSEENDFSTFLIFTPEGIFESEPPKSNKEMVLAGGGAFVLSLLVLYVLGRRNLKNSQLRKA